MRSLLWLVCFSAACSANGAHNDIKPPPPGQSPDGSDATHPSASGCKELALKSGTKVDGYLADEYTFYDAGCTPRSAALVRNDAADPGGSSGGFLRSYTYEVAGKTRTCSANSNGG